MSRPCVLRARAAEAEPWSRGRTRSHLPLAWNPTVTWASGPRGLQNSQAHTPLGAGRAGSSPDGKGQGTQGPGVLSSVKGQAGLEKMNVSEPRPEQYLRGTVRW